MEVYFQRRLVRIECVLYSLSCIQGYSRVELTIRYSIRRAGYDSAASSRGGMVDAVDLKSADLGRRGSSPLGSTGRKDRLKIKYEIGLLNYCSWPQQVFEWSFLPRFYLKEKSSDHVRLGYYRNYG